MGKNSKPILSILVDESKKEQFADLARRSKYSMAWLLNDCIDRMLAADSIHIYRDSMGISVGVETSESPTVMSRADIENIIKAHVSEHINISSIGIGDAEDITIASIENVVQPLNQSVEELRAELAEVSKLVRTLQDEIAKVKSRVDADTDADASVESSPQSIKTVEVNSNWDEPLAKLVATGVRSTGIAQKLTEMGYTNSKGGQIDRKSVEQRIARQPELKVIYQKVKPE